MCLSSVVGRDPFDTGVRLATAMAKEGPAMTPRFCANCGNPRDRQGGFCASCGSQFGPIPAVPVTAIQSGAAQAHSETVVPRIRTSVPDFIEKQLHPGERVLASYKASFLDHHRKHELRFDKFILTTERLIYYRTGFIHNEMDQMPYRGITGIQYNRGLRHGSVVVEAANAGLTIGGVSNDDAAFAERIIAAHVAGRIMVPVEAELLSDQRATSTAYLKGQEAGERIAQAMFGRPKREIGQVKERPAAKDAEATSATDVTDDSTYTSG